MPASVKFCGLTRPEDAALAASLGAGYVGVIFAPSPRRVDANRASEILEAAGVGPERVGVFASAGSDELAAAAREATLGVVQLHGDPSADDVEQVRGYFGGEVWGVARVKNGRLPESTGLLASIADALVLDAWSGARLGGTGERFAWEAVARDVEQIRPSLRGRLVLAGGLTADNVSEAIQLFAPDVVDVSLGVERSPGIKDHERMRAFARAALGDTQERTR